MVLSCDSWSSSPWMPQSYTAASAPIFKPSVAQASALHLVEGIQHVWHMSMMQAFVLHRGRRSSCDSLPNGLSSGTQEGETFHDGQTPSAQARQADPSSQPAGHSGCNHTTGFEDSLPARSACSCPAIPNGFTQPSSGQVQVMALHCGSCSPPVGVPVVVLSVSSEAAGRA